MKLAREKAEELGKKVKSGEKFDAAAKSLGLDPKTSDDVSRAGSIPSVGSGKQLGAVRNLWKHVGRQLLKDRLGLSKAPSVEEPSGRLKMLYCRNILRIRALLGRYGLGCRGRVARTAPASDRPRTKMRAWPGSGAGSFSRLTPSAGA